MGGGHRRGSGRRTHHSHLNREGPGAQLSQTGMIDMTSKAAITRLKRRR